MRDDNFTQLYDKLIEFLYDAMDDTLHNVADSLETAKEKVSQLGGTVQDYTQEELDRIGHYVMRDIEHAATSPKPVKDDDSLAEWLKFDIDLIENFALSAFMDIADKTQLALAQLSYQAKQYHPYKSGEISGPGTLTCDNCKKEIAFKSTSVIPECPQCGGDSFSRV